MGAAAIAQQTPDVLNDHIVLGVSDGLFPLIEERKGAQAQGVLLQGMSEDQIARLDYYEGGFAYDLRRVTLASGKAAQVYFPQPDQWQGDAPWDLTDWENRWGAMTCYAADEIMGYYGKRSAQEVATMFPVIRTRAWARVLAGQGAHRVGSSNGKVEARQVTRCYSNFYAIDEVHLRHSTFKGGWSDKMERAVFHAADAALVLPYDPIRDRVMVVEQFRVGPYARGDANCWQLEPIAGRIDPGEAPETAARREAQEEAGLTLSDLHKVGETYSSPGTSTEYYHTFVGIADLPDTVTGTHGLEAENEDIRSHLYSFDDFIALCDTQQAANTPLVMVGYWLARHRERLRLDQPGATS